MESNGAHGIGVIDSSMSRIVHLIPPQLSDLHIKAKIICIRSHRERLFQVAPEFRDNKFIIHNYGHGGAGWTFLFGCVQEAIRLFEQSLAQHPHFKRQPVLVIGAGCYGLLTAIMLTRLGYKVRCVAREIEDLASYKAAGFFFPRARKCSTPQERAIFRERGMESYRTYLSIVRSEHPFIKEGARIVSAYYGCSINPEFDEYISEGLLNKPTEVTIDFGNGKHYTMHEYHTLFMDASVLMRELHRERELLGIKIEQEEVVSFDACEELVIFNCAGYGAKALTQDARIVPVQGHLITLQNQTDPQALNYMINEKVVMQNPKGGLRDELIYFAPKDEGILGITFIRGQDSLTANQHEFDRLLQRSRDFFGM